MNETEIRKYAALMQELGLTGLEFTEDNKVVRLERSVAAPPPQTIPLPPAPIEPPKTSNDLVVRSNLVGVFYAAPAENADPYVNVGDRVKKGQTLCIIEAMKLMNEITAEEDGVVLEICAANGQVVEYGTALFRIGRADA